MNDHFPRPNRSNLMSVDSKEWLQNKPKGPDNTGEPPEIEGGDLMKLSERLAKVEGQISGLATMVGVVAATLLGAAAIVVGMQFYTLGKVESLSIRVDALPQQINTGLQQLVTTLGTAITAKNFNEQPTIIVVPSLGAPQSTTENN